MTNVEQQLQRALQRLSDCRPAIRRLHVAFSGGLDSTALLWACCRLRQMNRLRVEEGGTMELAAIHVNHGISPDADQWQSHCEQRCRRWRVPIRCESVNIESAEQKSAEAQARQARYAVFERQLQHEDVLLMAHHLDDQMETLMLRLLRGAGPRGLAAIPERRGLGRGRIMRPLLPLARAELEDYARQEQLDWVEDHSNSDERMDRNYLRHRLLLLLDERWPSWKQAWWRSARLCDEAERLANELAGIDLARLQTEAPWRLSCRGLQELDGHRQRNALRHWLERQGDAPVTALLLERLVREVLPARSDGAPRIDWQGREIRRFRGELYCFRPLPKFGTGAQYHWSPRREGDRLPLPGNGELLVAGSAPGGLKLPSDARLVIRYRREGEYCRLAGRPARPLKKVLQEAAVPPWLRSRLPLVTVNGAIAWVPGAGACEGFGGDARETGWALEWHCPPFRLKGGDDSGR